MNILIVTYTYPPAKSVNGFRPYHFAKTLTRAGWNVSVLTRHFSGDEQIPEDYGKPNHTPFSMDHQPEALVYRVPFYNSWFNYYQSTWIQSSGLWKVIYIIQLLFGRTHQESHNTYFKKYLRPLLVQKAYDLILVESGPTNLVRLVSHQAMKYRIPYAIDFRDAYYHEMYRDFRSLAWNKKIKIRLEEWYMTQPIRNSIKVFSLSHAWLEILKVPPGLRTVVNNGYDEEEWQHVVKNQPTDRFVIASIGTLYDQPVLDELLKCIGLFLQKGYKDVRVRFVAPGPKEVISKIRQYLPHETLSMEVPRVPYKKAIQGMADAHVLIYHGWKGWTELAGTKIFDYLRSGNRILILPSDDGPLKKWIGLTQAGIITDSREEGARALQLWYEEWKLRGKLESITELEQLVTCSRQYQSALLEQSLRGLLQPE